MTECLGGAVKKHSLVNTSSYTGLKRHSLNQALTCIGLEHIFVRTSFLALVYSSLPRVSFRLFCSDDTQTSTEITLVGYKEIYYKYSHTTE